MTPDPTDNRATAERIAREVYESGDKGLYEWKHLPDRSRENITAYVLAGMTHRDRTAERDALEPHLRMTDADVAKAWDATMGPSTGMDSFYSWQLLADVDKHRALTFARRLTRPVSSDRTAEREAARKAWDAAAERRYGPGWPVHSSSDKARDAYLAAEFDAGERVTLSDGSVVTRHPTDAECPWRRDYTNSTTRPPRITNATQWSDLFMPTDTGADFDAVKRLAEQRGAER